MGTYLGTSVIIIFAVALLESVFWSAGFPDSVVVVPSFAFHVNVVSPFHNSLGVNIRFSAFVPVIVSFAPTAPPSSYLRVPLEGRLNIVTLLTAEPSGSE